MTRVSSNSVSVMTVSLESRNITWLVAGSLVFQVIVAPVSVADEIEVLCMLGGVISTVLLVGDDVPVWLTK